MRESPLALVSQAEAEVVGWFCRYTEGGGEGRGKEEGERGRRGEKVRGGKGEGEGEEGVKGEQRGWGERDGRVYCSLQHIHIPCIAANVSSHYPPLSLPSSCSPSPHSSLLPPPLTLTRTAVIQ